MNRLDHWTYRRHILQFDRLPCVPALERSTPLHSVAEVGTLGLFAQILHLGMLLHATAG